MFKRIVWPVVLLLTGLFLAQHVQAQTLNGLLTGTITDPAGGILPGVQIKAVNRGTGETRTAVTNDQGVWLIPQLSPGTYKVSAVKPGFATVIQDNVQLDVNQSVTLDVKLTVAAANETIDVTTAPPLLNTTSATLSTIVGHQEVVDLPLNGREFTQLALLAPGEVPMENGQQSSFAIAEGAGGISPSTNGQRGEDNNFTIDGIENNELFDNAWAVSPPPDAIQEFNVQAHMTDAQFAVSSGANINVQTRTGTNSFHGDAWEFARNDDFDATQYPNSTRPFYHQNQYGFFVGGPVVRNRTFFSGYWEGYRFSQASVQFGDTLTANQIAGNYSQYVGTTPVGTDDLGRPEYTNELYDATTSRPDPLNPAVTIRDPFPAAPGGSPGSQIPSGYISSQALDYIKAFYPAPDMNVAPGVFPNFEYSGASTIKGDQFGARFDQQFSDMDSVFVRLARNDIHEITPASFNTLPGSITSNFVNEIELGYTHIFDPKTILNVRAAYVYENLDSNTGTTSDPSLTAAMGTQAALPPNFGANVPISGVMSNGLGSITNTFSPLGPSTYYEFNVDASKIVGHHTVSAGGMFFPLRVDLGYVSALTYFNQAGTSINGVTSGATGFSAASFLEGIIDEYNPYVVTQPADPTIPWWAFYGQDQWQVTRKLVLTFGTRWDYLGPTNYHKQLLVFDPTTGKMWEVGSPFTVPTSFLPVNDPTLYHVSPNYFEAKKNGWEPRFGATYQIEKNTVAHLGFAIIDQHDNELGQGNTDFSLNWPAAADSILTSLDIGVPTVYLNSLPTATSLLSASSPAMGTNGARNTPISYVEEYNAGIQQQLADHLSLSLDYVGSVGRHLYTQDTGNTAEYPGPGSIQARAQYPQYGTYSYLGDNSPSTYNGLQAKLVRPFAAGATFTASYTWSKSMDTMSDPESSPTGRPDWYDVFKSWGRSDYDLAQLFVFSGVYQLPFGAGRQFMHTPNKFVQEVFGGWQTAGILSMHSGFVQTGTAGADTANTGWGFEPPQRGSLSPYHRSGGGGSGFKYWLTAPTTYTGTTLPNPSTYAFTEPLPYTEGNEQRNDLTGPDFKNLDFSLQKNFPIWGSSNFQFRTEAFNIFNHTNYGGFASNVEVPSTFGQITSVEGNARIIQFSGKISF
jgi:hypothetical protein